MERVASCVCGELSVKVSDEPKISLACSCTNCQRRTGSAFGLSVYFSDSSIVETVGESKQFQGRSDSGSNFTTSFCTQCGSTVFWKIDSFKGLTGVAGGCFADPEFPEPGVTVWTRSKHKWVEFPENWIALEKQDAGNS